MLYNDTVILLYAKAPVEGAVNTRLIPDIGVEAATQLQHDFIHQRLLMLSNANLSDVFLMCAPNKEHACFLQCQKNYPVSLYEQSGVHLGERMINGVSLALEKYKYCIVIGTDAPALNAAAIKQAITVLHEGRDVVFVPAEDGGYVLVGLQQPGDFLFRDISWGSAQVMQQSRERLQQHGLSFEELATSWDVDRFDDYQRYLALIEQRL